MLSVSKDDNKRGDGVKPKSDLIHVHDLISQAVRQEL